MTAEVFLAAVRSSLRRSLFQRLKPLGLSSDEVNRLVTVATSRAMALSGVKDLADLAVAAGPVVDALATAAPGDPALANFEAVRQGVAGPVGDLVDQQIEA